MEANAKRLAPKFYLALRALFDRECEAVRAVMDPLWKNPSAWTGLMLDLDRGLLARSAFDTVRDMNVRCEAKAEWAKFDLMLVDRSGGEEWWLSKPIITIEHENGDGIHDEVWKLCCWTSRLKVLVTYHEDKARAEEKRTRAARIIRSVEGGEQLHEWLLISAPREWKHRLAWEAHEWAEGHWRELT